MTTLRLLAMALVLASVYTFALQPLERTLSASAEGGLRQTQALRTDLAGKRRQLVVLQTRLAARTAELTDRFGALRFAAGARRSPDSVLACVDSACAKVGGVLRSARPLEPFRTEALELAGFQCELQVPSERGLTDLLEGLQSSVDCGSLMIHELSVARAPAGFAVSAGFTLLGRAPGSESDEFWGLHEWLAGSRQPQPFDQEGLFERQQ